MTILNGSKVRVSLIFIGLALAFWLGRFSAERVGYQSPLDQPSDRAVLSGAEVVAPEIVIQSSSTDSVRDTVALRRAIQAPAKSYGAEDERQRQIEEWATIDPLAALEFARTKLWGDRQAHAMSSIITLWGKNDPAAAWAWVGSEMPEAIYYYDALLEVFGKQSTELAQQYASELAQANPNAALEVNLSALLGVAYRGDFAGARALIQANASSDPVLRANLNNFLAGQWARYEPQATAKWVMSLPAGQERDHAMIGLGESWSEVDPAGAARFASTLPTGDTRSLAMRQAVSKWVMKDPEGARSWVAQTDQYQDFDAAVEAVATQNNFMSREPALAMTWATGIFDDQLREKTISKVAHSWFMSDPTSVTRYLESAPDLSPELRTGLLDQLKSVQ